MNLAALWLSLALKVCHADTITEDFTSHTRFTSATTAVVNLTTYTVHVPWIVDRSSVPGDITDHEDDNVSIGDGSDGTFDASTISSFDLDMTGDPNIITLSSNRIYNFISFTIPNGKTVKTLGSEPLRLRVQGNVTIDGSLDVSGDHGSVLSASLSIEAPGGLGHAGGGTGGTGGDSSVPSASGTGGATGGGGIAGISSSTVGNSSGGGGGGTFDGTSAGTAGTAGSGGAGGAGGSGYGNVLLTTLMGGSGGAGGGTYTIGNTNQSTGGGGGGGGGALSIHAGGNIQIETTGKILANGGNGGGSTSATLLGGCGGGGSGGAILLFAAGRFINRGRITALGGTGGSGSGGGGGGSGGVGRTRFIDSTADWSLNATPLVENPEPNMADFGRIFYSKSAYVVETVPYDTHNSSPTYTGVTISDSTTSTSSITYQFSGSDDGFVSDATGWVSANDIGLLSGKRYVRFRATLQTTTRASTPFIRSVSIDYTKHTHGDFNFRAAGCAAVKRAETDWGTGIPTALGLLLVFLIPKIFRRQNKTLHSKANIN